MTLAEAVRRFLDALEGWRDGGPIVDLYEAEQDLREVLADWESRGDRVLSTCGCGGKHLVTVSGEALCGPCATTRLVEVKEAAS